MSLTRPDPEIDPKAIQRMWLSGLIQQQTSVYNALDHAMKDPDTHLENLPVAVNRARETYKLLLALLAEVA